MRPQRIRVMGRITVRAACLILITATAPVRAGMTYSFSELPKPSSLASASSHAIRAEAINNSGQVVGDLANFSTTPNTETGFS